MEKNLLMAAFASVVVTLDVPRAWTLASGGGLFRLPVVLAAGVAAAFGVLVAGAGRTESRLVVAFTVKSEFAVWITRDPSRVVSTPSPLASVSLAASMSAYVVPASTPTSAVIATARKMAT